jgi:hypothetical protein
MTNQDRNEILDSAHLFVLVSSLGGLGGVLASLFYIVYWSLFILIGLLALLFI